MASPLPFHRFQQLVKSYGCVMVMKGTHGEIFKDGVPVGGFAVTHGKHTKGNEVKPFYVRRFLKNIMLVEHQQ